MHAWCLFCETQRCAAIAALIEKTMGIRCINPRVIQRKWVKGKALEVSHPWLPGYLFLYTENALFSRPDIDGIIRLLGEGELTGQDRAFAEMLYQRDGVLGTIRLAEEGDRCRINDPLWESMEGRIRKIDRGRKRALVSFEFDSVLRSVWMGYEIIENWYSADCTDAKANDM